MPEFDEVLREELTPGQYDAATDLANEILCLACAGSGKSRTLAYRIARLVANGEDPKSIVAFTFTEKAAESIKRRVAHSLNKVGISPEVMGAMYIGTIHSYCQHILGEIDATYRQFDVLDENRLVLYLISRFYQLDLRSLYPMTTRGHKYFFTIKQVSGAWKTLNDEMLQIGDISNHNNELGAVLNRLSQALRDDQFIDFSLMIRHVVDALVEGDDAATNAVASLKHLMVDEYQDVSPTQEELIRQLHGLSETLFVVGDDDQSIYAWRGADVSNILTFEDRYPEATSHTLSENFRSTSAIVDTSDAFVLAELGPSRIEKNPSAVNNRNPRDFGTLWFDDREAEAAWVAERIEALLGTAYQEADGTVRGLTPADFAILMRSTSTSEGDGQPRHSSFTGALFQREIHYSLEAGGGPFDRPQIAVLRSTFELLRNGAPTRVQVREHFRIEVLPSYPSANFTQLVTILTEWGRLVHTPPGGARRRVYPQRLVYDILESFGISQNPLPDEIMREVGLFSQMIQDVEAVYMSVDSVSRFRQILNFLGNAADTGYDVSTDDIMQKPDAVSVMTVHKAKGLEFPVVFVVDVEARRFPGDRRRYLGWLPAEVIQPALDRGAYQRNNDEEARLFYTAITRAETYLYVTGAENLPAAKSTRKVSRFTQRLNHEEITNDPNQLPDGLVPHPQLRRIDETVMPTSYSEIRYYLKCPMDFKFRQRFGFSPSIPDMFGFGQTVHTAVEKLHEIYQDEPPTIDEAEEVTRDVFHLKHVPQSGDPINNPGPYERGKDKAVEIVQTYVDSYQQDFQRRRQVEARFEIPAQDCVISGAIDLLLRQDEQGGIVEAEVVDFKAMEGGDEPIGNPDLDWMELSLQVQLYAKAAQEVLGENAQTGSVHLLKDDQRIEVPITTEALNAAVGNVEWAVQGILDGDYPMRPHPDKCEGCDFGVLCPKRSENFKFSDELPPEIHMPDGSGLVRSFSQYDPDN